MAGSKWATTKDILAAGIRPWKESTSGVVLGWHPNKKSLMVSDDDKNILLVAPSRSGKGVSTVIPTALTWKESFFIFDPMSEAFALSANYRQKKLGQKIMQFRPSGKDASAVSWNPLAEVRVQTKFEYEDAYAISRLLILPMRSQQVMDSETFKDATELLTAGILHLLYKHHREGRMLPSLFDVSELFLTKEIGNVLESFQTYQHLDHEEAIQERLFQKLYGEYFHDLHSGEVFGDPPISTIDATLNAVQGKGDIAEGSVLDGHSPYAALYVHPKVKETGARMMKRRADNQASIVAVINSALESYRQPEIRVNMEQSDFKLANLLDRKQKISFYFSIDVCLVEQMLPIAALFTSMLMREAVIQSDATKTTHPHLLMMLDEFAQLRHLPYLEEFLAISNKAGTKVCIVAHDIREIDKLYSAENTILHNCQVQIYFTPVREDTRTSTRIAELLAFQNNCPSMKPEKICRMSRHKEIVFVDGCTPILGRKFQYYRYKHFIKCIKESPEING